MAETTKVKLLAYLKSLKMYVNAIAAKTEKGFSISIDKDNLSEGELTALEDYLKRVLVADVEVVVVKDGLLDRVSFSEWATTYGVLV